MQGRRAGVCVLVTVLSSGVMAKTQSFPLASPPGPQIYPNAMKDDDTGFVPIFDGKTLNGWDGDPKYWRVQNGEFVGEVTRQTLLKQTASSSGAVADRRTSN